MRVPDTAELARAVAALCVAAALATSCAGRGGSGAADAPTVRTIELFPLNVVVAIPIDLEEGVERVAAELERYLEAHGKAVSTLTLHEARQAWLENASALKAAVGESQMSFEGAASLLARRLHAERDFDALVIPWIALRAVRARGKSVKWDGVERTVPLSEDSDRKAGWFQHRWSQIPAPSLQVVVMAPDGRELFQGVGGLDLPYEMTIDVSEDDVDVHPRPDLFADPRTRREGIAIAFDPCLPPLDEE